MGNRCRVTFQDVPQDMKRSIEVDATSPMAAARSALRCMVEHHCPVEDFAPIVKVEVIRTTEHSLALSAVVSGHSEQNAEAA
jgi:hypothetical protein